MYKKQSFCTPDKDIRYFISKRWGYTGIWLEQMDGISPTFIYMYAFILARPRFGILIHHFHKFLTELWPLICVFTAKKCYSGAIVRFSDNSSLSWFSNSYLIHVILPSLSCVVRSLVVLELTRHCQCNDKQTSSSGIVSHHTSLL